MFNDGGRIKELRFGNPTCPYCGVTYPMIEKHDCPFSQETKLKAERERADKAEKELMTAKITLRDQFAMSASLEELATPEKLEDAAKYIGVSVEEYNSTIHWYQVVSKARYEFADAMLEARKAR